MRTVLCTVGLLVFIASVHAQKVEVSADLQSLVETERAFARTSEAKGVREAFLSFIADDGILFRPTAVNGKRWLNENPLPASQKRPLLSWQPIFANVSFAGDLGYTTGPWQYKTDINDERPLAFGNFVTLWKKQVDGSWKFVVDLGITNPQPADSFPGQLPVVYGTRSDKPPGPVAVESLRSELINRDREFSRTARAQGALKAFLSYCANEVRLFRNDGFPHLGKNAAAQVLSTGKNSLAWQPASADVSGSGELGYTYGTYEVRSTDTAQTPIETGNYLRIWQRQNGAWQVVVDVANPLPPAEKKN